MIKLKCLGYKNEHVKRTEKIPPSCGVLQVTPLGKAFAIATDKTFMRCKVLLRK